MQVAEANDVIWNKKVVEYKGVSYYLTAVIKRRHNQKAEWYYQAELRDMTALHSVVIADLNLVEIGGDHSGD